MPAAEPVNMADVARHAGVSTATVSRALRDLPGVSEATRIRVKAVAAKLAYVVSPEASRLSRGATGRVAVVVPRINAWYFSTMLAGLESVLREAELDMLLYHVGGATDRQRFFERLPTRRKADAVVIVALPVPEQDVDRLELMGVEVVVAGARIADYPDVRIDDAAAAVQAVQHLMALGHTRIAMIRTEDPEGTVWPVDLARWRGYREALAAGGLDYDERYVATIPFTNDGGAEGMAQLLSLRQPPTAVFAHSDEIAMAALRTLRRAHVAVPSAMSVVGIDDHPMAELLDLTTVRQPVEEQGRRAALMVLDLLSGRPLPERDVVVPTHLVLRGTTGPDTSAPSRAGKQGSARASQPATVARKRAAAPRATRGKLSASS